PVRAPELLAVQDERVAVELGGRREARRIGADVWLGQRERRDRAARAAREVLPLLLGRAEELQRLRDADRLVGGQQRGDVRIVAADELHRRRVLTHGEPEPAVLLRDLDAEGAELPEPVDDLLRVLARLVDRDGVDLLAQERLQRVVELLKLRPPLPHGRKRVDVLQEEVAEEELAQEGPSRPFLLAGLLGDLSRLFLARRPYVRRAQRVTLPAGRTGARRRTLESTLA